MRVRHWQVGDTEIVDVFYHSMLGRFYIFDIVGWPIPNMSERSWSRVLANRSKLTQHTEDVELAGPH